MVLQDGVEAVEFVLFALVPDGWCEGVGDDVGEFVSAPADFDDVAVGAGDVRAAGRQSSVSGVTIGSSAVPRS
ncbi:hypothetical protein ACIHDR_43560 [Nocardia sp. NPDC052278]|uniref:hypothetical protein n=1 Tax=unclassified Nocardia TaxID=2637762 RepID=UPI003676AA2A